ncbi:4-carboxymuconolactone decarboxylase [Limnohabitans sp. TS-CS-82]|jgi:4-carboxymuconolactone decarboxylase|uniref:carboxymuconolactone decarboxylase family protein n=1 Tax=Limnohabitans sp. TS-CS-82 TaxID=2094193 RepID=UPI000CF2F533|nr:carboxymuconolactone decarboxylase family protein [Limnohabitans sp. TS-CS-82]PQA83235.1 4-carboxymuconolactone decarboxylase [Limnohabitans sp. TS-CS-82]
MSNTPTSPSQQARAERLDDAAFQAGLTTRTQVMGPEFVDRAFGNATDYTLPMQEFITRNAWGNVWQRPGLDLKTRSLVTVAMLTALGKQHELKAHARGALNNGATPEELREVMLHATVYCGFPTAIDAFRSVTEVVESLAKP